MTSHNRQLLWICLLVAGLTAALLGAYGLAIVLLLAAVVVAVFPA